MWDAIIIGGGNAGLSAALVLGRARRRVLVCDVGAPRNAVSAAVHGFYTRDGTSPGELLATAHAQLHSYPSVHPRQTAVVDAFKQEQMFALTLADGTHEQARKVVVASGVQDILPPIAGLQALWGRGVYHCPYCHGWEVSDQPLAAYGRGEMGVQFARTLLGWSRDLVLCTDGPAELEQDDRQRLARWNVGLREEAIERVEGHAGRLDQIVFRSGAVLPRHGLFIRPRQQQRSDVAERLGCVHTELHGIRIIQVDEQRMTSVAGVYAVGDAARVMQQAIIAAADGAVAAGSLNNALLADDFG